MERETFTGDWTEKGYKGYYVKGQTWNGWESPSFNIDTLTTIINDSEGWTLEEHKGERFLIDDTYPDEPQTLGFGPLFSLEGWCWYLEEKEVS